MPNLTDQPLNVYWVNFQCNEELYDTIQPGAVFYQTTYDGHEWVFRNASGQEVKRFTASTSSPTVLIGADAFNPEPVVSNCSSAATDQAIDLTVINNTDKPILLYWIAYDCTEQFYGVVRGKDRFVQSTFIGHDWVVRFVDGRIAKQVTVSTAENTVIIDPPPVTNQNTQSSTPAGNVPPPPPPSSSTALPPSAAELTERIVFAREENDISQLYSINSDGSGEVNLTQVGTENLGPVFSPDGTRILFFSIRDGDTDEELYVMNVDGSNVQRLTNNNEHDFHADYSPDGRRIVFVSNRDADNEIYIMNADGTNVQRLTNNTAADREPKFSPDGNRIIFASERDGNREIYVMNVDGTNVQRLTNNAGRDVNATFSPDGSRIIFSSDRDGNRELYIMNADGTNVQRLTNNPVVDFFPTFSPDGSKIVFVRHEADEIDRLYVMNIDGTNAYQLTQGSTPAWSLAAAISAAATDTTAGGPTCQIQAKGANTRAEPNTQSDRVSTVDGYATAVAQTQAADGFLWYRLRNNSWIRSDVVFAEASCANLPMSR